MEEENEFMDEFTKSIAAASGIPVQLLKAVNDVPEDAPILWMMPPRLKEEQLQRARGFYDQTLAGAKDGEIRWGMNVMSVEVFERGWEKYMDSLKDQ